jgi:hypothetical protein
MLAARQNLADAYASGRPSGRGDPAAQADTGRPRMHPRPRPPRHPYLSRPRRAGADQGPVSLIHFSAANCAPKQTSPPSWLSVLWRPSGAASAWWHGGPHLTLHCPESSCNPVGPGPRQQHNGRIAWTGRTNKGRIAAMAVRPSGGSPNFQQIPEDRWIVPASLRPSTWGVGGGDELR